MASLEPATPAPPTGLSATGADQSANLKWSAAATGTDTSVSVLYCDDGSASTATAQLSLDLSDECPSRTTLVPGQVPSVNAKFCGLAADGVSTAHVSGLTNGRPYAFAIATRGADGQVSALSALTCAIPSANGEYELDGTSAGKNACSVSDVGLHAPAAGTLVLVLGVLCLLRRARHALD